MTTHDLLIVGGAFGLTLVVMAFVWLRRTGPGSVSTAVIARMSRPGGAVAGDIRRTDRLRSTGKEFLAKLYQLNMLRTLEENMWQAGIYIRVADILLIILLLFGAGLFAGRLLLDDAWLSLATACGAGFLPLLYIRVRKKRRLKAFVQQLPYALDMIKSSLEAGHTLLRALQVIVTEFPDPLGSEFRSAIEQSRLGLPMPRAIEEMLKRVPEDDLRLFVVAVRVQADVGSSLAVIVGRLSEIVRTRQRLQQQIKALTAQSRMSGLVVGLLPILMLAAFSVIQPSYTHTLFSDPNGIRIIKIAAVLDVLGFLSIRRMLQVKY
ncbi:MAG: type II secretion system F family protein [Candidatus Binatus sp.]|uniref:type II secretion system F family protein n=1 Tax=Candidatus Binatus sp. TaxID=2811406 RepID=UPI0027274207|nr:type II secretion system F family protein [Candidatus Binatus sp.]MDO8432401.1 type II secretion system F family protein [Candidatus Binatus sp.]